MPNATREQQGKRSLLDICLSLHMQNTGAADKNVGQHEGPTYAEDVNLLALAAAHWEPELESTADFDNAVLRLIMTTLRECGVRVTAGFF